MRLSYLYNGNCYTGKMTLLYRDRPLVYYVVPPQGLLNGNSPGEDSGVDLSSTIGVPSALGVSSTLGVTHTQQLRLVSADPYCCRKISLH